MKMRLLTLLAFTQADSMPSMSPPDSSRSESAPHGGGGCGIAAGNGNAAESGRLAPLNPAAPSFVFGGSQPMAFSQFGTQFGGHLSQVLPSSEVCVFRLCLPALRCHPWGRSFLLVSAHAHAGC